MASGFELDAEVIELLQNYKHKKSTVYEPCTLNNISECLIGLGEEFDLLNISYIFNPHVDIHNERLRPDALVKLINCIWILLHKHKNTADRIDGLAEHNHILENNNKQLNDAISKLKEKLSIEKNEARACVSSAQRAVDRSDHLLQTLSETKAKLTQLTRQKLSVEKNLQHEIIRLKLENENLLNKLRLQSGSSKANEDYDPTILQLQERLRKQNAVISQLQENNQNLIREVLALKEEIILTGLMELKTDKRKL